MKDYECDVHGGMRIGSNLELINRPGCQYISAGRCIIHLNLSASNRRL